MSCEILCGKALGIVGTTSDIKLVNQVEDIHALTAIYFPTLLPGVTIRIVNLRDTPMYLNEDDSFFGDDPVKCFLFFFSSNAPMQEEIKVHAYLFRLVNTNGQAGLCVGGARIGEVNIGEQDAFAQNFSYGIIFSGSNAEGASLVILEEMTTTEIEMKMVQLYETNTESQYAQRLAFVFSCVPQNEECEPSSTEMTIFRQLFPTVPLFGVFSPNGGLGIECFPNISKTAKFGSALRLARSVFVLLCLKK